MTNLDDVHRASIPSENRLEHVTITIRSGLNPNYSFRSPVACPLEHRHRVASRWFSKYISSPDSGLSPDASFTRRIGVSCHHDAVTFRRHDVTFSKCPPPLQLSHFQNGLHGCIFKMAAPSNQVGITSPHRVLKSTRASLLHHMFLLPDTFVTNSSPSPELTSPSDVATFENFCSQITACYTRP